MLAQEKGRKKMNMEENAGYKKSELLLLMLKHSLSLGNTRRSGTGVKEMKPAELALRAIKEKVSKLEKDGKDKEKGGLWDSIRKECGGNVSHHINVRVIREAGEKGEARATFEVGLAGGLDLSEQVKFRLAEGIFSWEQSADACNEMMGISSSILYVVICEKEQS